MTHFEVILRAWSVLCDMAPKLDPSNFLKLEDLTKGITICFLSPPNTVGINGNANRQAIWQEFTHLCKFAGIEDGPPVPETKNLHVDDLESWNVECNKLELCFKRSCGFGRALHKAIYILYYCEGVKYFV
jgi:hypothetical protein